MDAPVAKQPATEQAADDITPPDEMSEDEAMADDGFTPPDEMPEEAMSDEAPDAMTPAENPEEAVAEDPPPANP